MIKPCHFCGSDELTFRNLDGDYVIVCNGCYAMGPVGTDKPEAETKWNSTMVVEKNGGGGMEKEIAALQHVIERKDAVIDTCKDTIKEQKQIFDDYAKRLCEKSRENASLKTHISLSTVEEYEKLEKENKKLQYEKVNLINDVRDAERKAHAWWRNIVNWCTDGFVFIIIMGIVAGLFGFIIGVYL